MDISGIILKAISEDRGYIRCTLCAGFILVLKAVCALRESKQTLHGQVELSRVRFPSDSYKFL